VGLRRPHFNDLDKKGRVCYSLHNLIARMRFVDSKFTKQQEAIRERVILRDALGLKINLLSGGKENIMGTPVTVPMVGKIVSVLVKVGDKIKEDDQVAVLEAMKMEMPIVSPVTGTVKEICVGPGQEVEAEAVIAVIE